MTLEEAQTELVQLARQVQEIQERTTTLERIVRGQLLPETDDINWEPNLMGQLAGDSWGV